MLDGTKWGHMKRDDDLSISDEEILPLEGLSDEDEEDEDDGRISDGQDDERSLSDEDQQEEDLDKDIWGSSRKVYYGANDVSDDEEIAQEEQEADRLQKRHLARLRPEDFIDSWADVSKADTTHPTNSVVMEELPAPDFSRMSKEELLKVLKTRHPDVLRLAGLYQQLYPELFSLSLLAARPVHPQHTIVKLKYALLCVLLSSIAVFFAFRADQKERKFTEQKLLARIAETETLWRRVSSVPIDENALDIGEPIDTRPMLEERLALPETAHPTKRKESALKRKRIKNPLAASDDSDSGLAETLALLKRARKKRNAESQRDSDDHLGDTTTLHSLNAEEKAKNKKSLRFYTAQIESKISKRREKYSGDMEVFKERRNDRNERELEAARRRGLPTNSREDITALDDEEPEPMVPVSLPTEEDDYYDFIAAKTARKKDIDKKAEYKAAKASAKASMFEGTEEGDESGKRLITRQIEKNKGLMPKRSKDVRNPRVKKRKRYEKKVIALKGRQKVYQVNDRRRGAYGGEETGISKNVVHSIKLG